ncbi:MAG: ECF transporter S component, partial [Clostridia bacterium]|nr:ECF transporter S component [Clostridia bacterium]
MKTQKIALTALMSALIFVCTAYLIIPLPYGYVNFGDTVILITSALLGPFAGGICGALGAGLADLVTGYVMYMPFTVVIKFAEGVLFGFLFKLVKKNKKFYFFGTLLSLILSTFLMGFGYFISNILLFDVSVAIADVVYECIQAGASVVIAMTALLSISHIDYFVKNFSLRPIFKKRKYDYGRENMAKRVAVVNDLSSFGKCSLT